MRDPNRIDEVLEALREYWIAHPEMRLGQILVNLVGAKFTADIFYVEDETLLEKLKETINNRKENHYEACDRMDG